MGAALAQRVFRLRRLAPVRFNQPKVGLLVHAAKHMRQTHFCKARTATCWKSHTIQDNKMGPSSACILRHNISL